MTNKLLVIICATLIGVCGASTILAQEETTDSADPQKEAWNQVSALTKQLGAREKEVAAQPAVLEARKLMDDTAAALKDFQANNAAYVAVKNAADATAEASHKAWADATKNDVQYPVLCDRYNELQEKQRNAKTNQKDGTRGVPIMPKDEKAALDKEGNDLKKSIKEREQMLSELPEVKDTKKAAAVAEAALQDFIKNNAEYNKLLTASRDAAPAYRTALELAKNNDQEYSSLKKQLDEARARHNDLKKKTPKKP